MEQRGHSPKLFPPRAIQSIISSAKNRMIPAPELAAASPFDRIAQTAADVMGAMGAALKSANAMDFDDLLLHPLTLFRERPDRLEYWRDRFSFLIFYDSLHNIFGEFVGVTGLPHAGEQSAVAIEIGCTAEGVPSVAVWGHA